MFSSPIFATPSDDPIIQNLLSILPSDKKDWQLIGIVNKDKDVFTFGNDSKIVGRAFEVVATAYIKMLADNLGYEFYESENQTVYPDFLLVKPNGRKIAIDVKSTYRKKLKNGSNSAFKFTLGSFTSYLRNNTKNIVGNYSDYDGHYVLAFLYSRTQGSSTSKQSIADLDSIKPAYDDVEVIFQEKYRLGGDKTGSGNTDNLATFSATTMEPFAQGASPFSILGEDVFNHYWRNHPRNKDSFQQKEALFKNLPDYFSWLEKQDNPPFDPAQLRKDYELYKKWVKSNGWSISLS